jgi:LIVCS family branched-chain amino acid:cation transporter
MHQYKSIAIYGFTIFAMFFGSGNLVFPLEVGYYAPNNWLHGFLGFFLTGIILPFLGLFVIKLHKGNYYNFFNEAGSIAKYAIPLFTLSLLGSFGVVPRCITVAHGGIAYVYPQMSLWVFALIFCITSFILCLKDHLVVKMLGKWMSPLLLIALLLLIIVGVDNSSELTTTSGQNDAFVNGFFKGYQLMDLFAAFFFSAFIFQQLQAASLIKNNDKDIIIFAIKASVVGSLLLAMIYCGLVFLGAHYAFLLDGVSPEYMLPTIAKYLMGDFTVLFLSIPVVLSCLTTAIALNNIYARYLCTLFQLGDDKFPLMLCCTTFIAFVISLMNFNAIAAFLALALDISYPGLIFLTIMGIIFKDKYHKFKIYSFWLITLMAILY